MHIYQSVGVSIPKSILTRIDMERGDISRSRYILRILEKIYPRTEVRGKLDIREQESRSSDLQDQKSRTAEGVGPDL